MVPCTGIARHKESRRHRQGNCRARRVCPLQVRTKTVEINLQRALAAQEHLGRDPGGPGRAGAVLQHSSSRLIACTEWYGTGGSGLDFSRASHHSVKCYPSHTSPPTHVSERPTLLTKQKCRSAGAGCQAQCVSVAWARRQGGINLSGLVLA